MQILFSAQLIMPALVLIFLTILCGIAFSPENKPVQIVFSCRENNDLYKVIIAGGLKCECYNNVAQAIQSAPDGSGVLILAGDYPENTVNVDQTQFELAAEKKLRLYIEYPMRLPSIGVGQPQHAELMRGVVTSDAFGDTLKPMRIVMLHDCHFVPVQVEHALIVLARVAGLDRAVYELKNTQTFPLLFEHQAGNILVATSKLSQFVSGRYAPSDAWSAVWEKILNWLQPGKPIPRLKWTPSVHPMYDQKQELPVDIEMQALRSGIEWFFNARLLIHPSWQKTYHKASQIWKDSVGPMPEPEWPAGAGSLGVLEGFSSNIHFDGSQKLRWWVRNDCNGEVAGAMALAAAALGMDEYQRVAGNIGDFIYFKSIMSQGNRAAPAHPAFGLISWNDVPEHPANMAGSGIYYGDDNARGLLGSLAAAAVLNTDRWDERMLQCLLANLRTAGSLGFRHNRIDEDALEKNGWRHYFKQETISYAPHYQAYLWACYLWAYHCTKYDLFLQRAKTAIRLTMQAYADQWHWTNGIQQERARMLLPLAWLVRVENTPEHREWLKFMARELLVYQDDSGAIREALGEAGKGSYHAPESNAAYGTTEAPLLQNNGDPVCDLLYTTNFALLGLHEAAAATGDAYYREAEDRLTNFLCRIQVSSQAHPELDGAWFRAFDFNRWEYWASNADAGWGAWCTESGWTQGWITMLLGLRLMNRSLWDLTADSKIAYHLDKNRNLMLPYQSRKIFQKVKREYFISS